MKDIKVSVSFNTKNIIFTTIAVGATIFALQVTDKVLSLQADRVLMKFKDRISFWAAERVRVDE